MLKTSVENKSVDRCTAWGVAVTPLFVKHHKQRLRKCKATKKVNRICETTAHRSVRHGHAGRVACVFMRHHLVRQTRRIARCRDSNDSSEQAARPLQEKHSFLQRRHSSRNKPGAGNALDQCCIVSSNTENPPSPH